MKLNSFKDAMEHFIREGFETEMLQALDSIQHEAETRLKKNFEKVKIDIKKQAKAMTVEIMQKANMDGITIEFKI